MKKFLLSALCIVFIPLKASQADALARMKELVAMALDQNKYEDCVEEINTLVTTQDSYRFFQAAEPILREGLAADRANGNIEILLMLNFCREHLPQEEK